MEQTTQKTVMVLSVALLAGALLFTGCSSDKGKNKAKESAARYWQDKAYPGKAFDVQVIEAEDAGNGTYRVKGIVDGETRVGVWNPETETFSEGYYSLAHERNKRIAELEQEVKYWKEKFEGMEKDMYKLKVKLEASEGSTGRKTSAKAAEKAAPEKLKISLQKTKQKKNLLTKI